MYPAIMLHYLENYDKRKSFPKYFYLWLANATDMEPKDTDGQMYTWN